MKIRKKVLVIGLVCAVVLGATIGGFAMANADDNGATSGSANTTATAVTTLLNKVAEIYQTNTGTAIDAQQLQKAFEEAGAAIKADKLDQMLQKLVDSGKITQAQADQWKTWWNSRPTQALSDEYKTWLQSRPSLPGLSGGNNSGIMPFRGFHGMGRGMMRGLNTQ